MSNINTIEKGERLSFYKLINEKKYRILIPIIQRDYAQGRTSKRQIRENFVNALYNYLDENKPNRDLDFVYGTANEKNDFIPLDGQQRLTTLFLLHWYLYNISNNLKLKKDFKDSILCKNKPMFSYETRISSSEFCSALLQNDVDFNNLLETDYTEDGKSLNNSLSNTIKNESWFYLSWHDDPTIKAMLVMLDSINKRFANKKEFFERLLDLDNPIITFQFLNLKDFKLTDDLYIKMNSRGKPLTEFENFKAKFEQYIKQFENVSTWSLDYNGEIKDVSIEKYFSYNIDTKWANLFWNYRNLQSQSKENFESKNSVDSKDDNYDNELINFIRVILTNAYIENNKNIQNSFILEYLLGTQSGKKDLEYSDVISFFKYEELGIFVNPNIEQIKDISCDEHERLNKLSLIYIEHLIKVLDCLWNGNEKIYKYMQNSGSVAKLSGVAVMHN